MSKGYHQKSASEWLELIRECRSSGLSDYQWCRQNRISPTSFYRNLKKLHNSVEAGFPEDIPAVPVPAAAQEIVPLKLADELAMRPAAVKVPEAVPAARVQAGGISIELFDNADPAFLSGLLKAVSLIC